MPHMTKSKSVSETQGQGQGGKGEGGKEGAGQGTTEDPLRGELLLLQNVICFVGVDRDEVQIQLIY